MSDRRHGVPTTGVRETLVLARAIARKALLLRVRGAFDTLGGLLAVYVLFLLVVFGGRRVAPDAIEGSLSAIVVGFFLLVMATVAYADRSWGLARAAQRGTIEQLFTSPLGFRRVVLVETAVNLVVAFGYGVALLGLMLLTTGRGLRLDPVAVVPIGFLTLATAAGVGLAVGGLALVYERVENVFLLVGMAFVALVAAPVGEVAALKLLPLSLGSHLLRLVMVEGRTLWALPPLDLALLVGVALGYLGAGYAVFGVAVRLARRRGTLGAG